jgi:hydroxylamine reductase
VLSWYEQKAVAVLLSLLSLGIKNIRLGPSLPAFITPNILKVLVEKFNIMPTTTPDADLKAIME